MLEVWLLAIALLVHTCSALNCSSSNSSITTSANASLNCDTNIFTNVDFRGNITFGIYFSEFALSGRAVLRFENCNLSKGAYLKFYGSAGVQGRGAIEIYIVSLVANDGAIMFVGGFADATITIDKSLFVCHDQKWSHAEAFWCSSVLLLS